MRFKIGDKVRVKSLEWYNSNKNKFGQIRCNEVYFQPDMSRFCGSILIIKNIDTFLNAYQVEENSFYWSEDMFEENVEYVEEFINAINTAYHACLDEYNEVPNKISQVFISDKNYQDKVELCLDKDYEIVVEDGRTFVQRKKSKYPTTYEECCDVLKIPKDERYIDIDIPLSYNNPLYKFTELLICRDAYWKISGEEMGLGEPWKSDWADNYQKKWLINFYQDEINLTNGTNVHFVLAFPTKEMRDAFYENFKCLIEKCKELL